MTAPPRLPDPVDPAAPPRRLVQAAVAVLLGGFFMGVLGVIPQRGVGDGPTLMQQVLIAAWFVSLPVGGAVLLAYNSVRRRRLRRFERRAGFLPRKGRFELPPTDRTTLFRVEYGQRSGRVCLMLARWDHHWRDGWARTEVVHHAWHSADDAVALGAERARMTALAEQLEEEADDARLAGERAHRLAAERLAERAATRKRATRLVEQLARDSR